MQDSAWIGSKRISKIPLLFAYPQCGIDFRLIFAYSLAREARGDNCFMQQVCSRIDRPMQNSHHFLRENRRSLHHVPHQTATGDLRVSQGAYLL